MVIGLLRGGRGCTFAGRRVSVYSGSRKCVDLQTAVWLCPAAAVPGPPAIPPGPLLAPHRGSVISRPQGSSPGVSCSPACSSASCCAFPTFR